MRDCAEAVEYLCELAAEHGVDVVETKIIDEYHLRIWATGDGADNDDTSPEDERHTDAVAAPGETHNDAGGRLHDDS